MSELWFNQFYDIRLGLPEPGLLASFSFVTVDNYARVSERMYGTIVPVDPTSVHHYDPSSLEEMLAEYLQETLNVYKVKSVQVIMKADEKFSEEGLTEFFDDKLDMLCIRGGLAIDNSCQPQTVYDKFPIEHISEWDCAIINELAACRGMAARLDTPTALAHFKKTFPSVMLGYEGPNVSTPPVSFMNEATLLIDEVLDYYGVQPFNVVRTPTAVYYEVYGDIDLSATDHRITVKIADGKRVWRQSLVRGKQLVIDAMRSYKAPEGVTVGTKDFRRIMEKLDTSVHDIISEGSDVLQFSLDQRVIVYNHGHSFTAEFVIGERSYKLTLVYRIDVDSFIQHLEDVLNGDEDSHWFPHSA